MYSYSNTFLKWSICIRIHIHDFIMYLYSYSITFVCIRPHVCTQVIMTGRGREDNKGNNPRKRKPGDSPLTRGMCVGIAISMNTSLHVASALIYFQCRMLSFFQEN